MNKISAAVLFFSISFCKAEVFKNITDTTRIISGKVTGTEAYSPLEGAAVVVKGTKNITGTMIDGAFSMFVSEKDSVLVISLDGYETKEIKLTKEIFYEVVLKHANSNLPKQIVLTPFHNQFLVFINR
jgi:TonB-dependent starch-binding outer membrane protein SusC